MVKTRVTAADIQSLRDKLLQVGTSLTVDECGALQAVLELAAESAAHRATSHQAARHLGPRAAAFGRVSAARPAGGEAPKLTDGFEGSYRWGRTATFSIR